MKRRLLPPGLLLLAASGLVLTGCGANDGPEGPSSGGDGPTIAAGFYPLAFVAERVAGEHASVVNLTQPGVESHDLELTGRQVSAIADADLVVYLKGFQPAVDDAIEQNSPETVIDAADVAHLIPEDHTHDDAGESEDGHDHADDDAHADEHDDHAGEDDAPHDEHHDEHDDAQGEDTHTDDEQGNADGEPHEDEAHADEAGDDGHDHGDLEGDPHLWLDPANVVALTHAVEDALMKIAPDNADAYQTNAEDLIAELEKLDEEFETGLAQCERSLIVVSHEAFGYLAENYGLEQLGVAGLDPDSEPSPARVAEVHDTIQAEGVTTVFYERLTSPDAVESLAADLGLETAVLDPIEGLTDETIDQDYFSLMRENLQALRAANGCS